jgi:hypothetical protein
MEFMIIVWIASAALCGYVATQKNRNCAGWAAAGFLLGIFAVIAIAVVPPIKE